MKKNKKKEILFAYSWSAPSLILILLIVIFPILYTGYISLTNMNVYHWNNYELIGLKNYKDALLVLDNGFIQAFLVTILWTIVEYGVAAYYRIFAGKSAELKAALPEKSI